MNHHDRTVAAVAAVLDSPDWNRANLAEMIAARLDTITEGDAFDVVRSLRFQARQLRKSADTLDSTASFLATRYCNPADREVPA